MIIAVDFDGTLHTGAYPSIGDMRPGAQEYMQKLKNDGHYIILNTCRCGDTLLEAINWCLWQSIPIDRVNDNHPELVAKYQSNSRKISADIYVDDKQIIELPSWEEIYKHVLDLTYCDTKFA